MKVAVPPDNAATLSVRRPEMRGHGLCPTVPAADCATDGSPSSPFTLLRRYTSSTNCLCSMRQRSLAIAPLLEFDAGATALPAWGCAVPDGRDAADDGREDDGEDAQVQHVAS